MSQDDSENKLATEQCLCLWVCPCTSHRNIVQIYI